MRLRATFGGLLAAALLVLLVPAPPAFAHSTLLKTDPADGATVSAPPAAITLTFNENIKQQFSTIVVTGADGASYSDGAPHAVDKTLTQAVKPLPTGAVKVAWRTVSADGHPIEGRFAFTNAASAPPAAAGAMTAAAPTEAPSSPQPTAVAEPAGDGGSSGWLWAVAGGVAVVLLAAGALLWRRRSGTGQSG
ncbi:copper resistance CopC family protein [Dactylosporangium salmoneum]|uniref:CopC domain-containing protein n=1 Tax=Dactylosporangium salmoneum TaxID=53361 RepID=A0ABN3FBF4_9ACTN